MADSRWDTVVILCAANNWDSVKVADQYMAESLSRLVPVLYVDPPISHLTPLKQPYLSSASKAPRLKYLRPQLARLTPVIPPFGRRPALRWLSDPIIRHQLQKAARAVASTVKAVICGSPDWSVFGICAEETSVYWAQDDFVGLAGLLHASALNTASAEASISAAADLLVTSSPHVTKQWSLRGHHPVLIPFGCDSASFIEQGWSLPTRKSLGREDDRPVAGIVGQLNSRIDLRLLEEVAESDLTLMLVGPIDPGFEPKRIGSLLRRENVNAVGPVPFTEVPRWMKRFDVGLVPYNSSAFNLGSFPLKALEYLASGVPVVATDLPSMRWFPTELIKIATDPAEFAKQVNDVVILRSDPELVTLRQDFARKHDWSERAAALLGEIQNTNRSLGK